MAFWEQKKLQTTFDVGTILHQRKVANNTDIELQIKEVLLHVQENNVNFLKDKNIHDLFAVQANIFQDLKLILGSLDDNNIELQKLPKSCRFDDSKQLALFLLLQDIYKRNGYTTYDKSFFIRNGVNKEYLSYKKILIISQLDSVLDYLMLKPDIKNALFSYDDVTFKKIMERLQKMVLSQTKSQQEEIIQRHQSMNSNDFLMMLRGYSVEN